MLSSLNLSAIHRDLAYDKSIRGQIVSKPSLIGSLFQELVASKPNSGCFIKTKLAKWEKMKEQLVALCKPCVYQMDQHVGIIAGRILSNPECACAKMHDLKLNPIVLVENSNAIRKHLLDNDCFDLQKVMDDCLGKSRAPLELAYEVLSSWHDERQIIITFDNFLDLWEISLHLEDDELRTRCETWITHHVESAEFQEKHLWEVLNRAISDELFPVLETIFVAVLSTDGIKEDIKDFCRAFFMENWEVANQFKGIKTTYQWFERFLEQNLNLVASPKNYKVILRRCDRLNLTAVFNKLFAAVIRGDFIRRRSETYSVLDLKVFLDFFRSYGLKQPSEIDFEEIFPSNSPFSENPLKEFQQVLDCVKNTLLSVESVKLPRWVAETQTIQ